MTGDFSGGRRASHLALDKQAIPEVADDGEANRPQIERVASWCGLVSLSQGIQGFDDFTFGLGIM